MRIIPERPDGPSKSWTDKSLDGINVPPVDSTILKQMAITVASASTEISDCILLLDALGIDIKEVWS